MRDEVAWMRLQDRQRELENRRFRAQESVGGHFLNTIGQRVWTQVGIRFGWLPELRRPTFPDPI